tara:strand:- start:439 stop:1086 length:648 start_codon:yes stop_codon:yes gene_type:complete
MKIAIVMHHDFRRDNAKNFGLLEDYGEYERGIKKDCEESDFTLEVIGRGSSPLFPELDASQQFTSYGRLTDHTTGWRVEEGPYIWVHTGYLESDHFRRMEKFIEGKEGATFTIHGSNAGECAEDIAFQIYLIINKHPGAGNIWRNWDIAEETKLRYCGGGLFATSKIRYGHVSLPIDTLRSIPPCEMFPHGNMTHQLTDEKTRFYQFCLDREAQD